MKSPLLLALLCSFQPLSTARAQDLASLPEYKPTPQVSGTIRIFGRELYGAVRAWETGFAKLQPDVHFADFLPSSDAAIGAIEQGNYDLAPSGRELVLDEYLGFFETLGYNPLEITVGSGGYDQPGSSWNELVFVNAANPLAKLTLKQLDGVFGSERTGGYVGFKWVPQTRTAAENIRTWGQLGLTGDWSDHAIQTYGYVASGMAAFFQLKVFHGGDKWNENYREYAETGTKIMSEGEEGQSVGIVAALRELEKNRYGIGWAGYPQIAKAGGVPGIKALAIAEAEGGPYVEPTKANMMNRTYPLTRNVYIYLRRAPGDPVELRLKEFLRYVLSREGQKAVLDGAKYLPLTRAVVDEQLRKLE